MNITNRSLSNESTSTYQGTDKLIFGMVLSILTFWLFSQSINAFILDVQKDTNISSSVMGTAVSLTTLFTGVFIIILGDLADKMGRVKFTQIGLILSILGSICLIFAHGPVLLILGRIFQGLSGAILMPATLSLIKSYYKDKDRQRALSFWSIGSWGGMGSSLLVGGMISTYFGWRTVFMISIVVAIIAMLIVKGTPESKIKKEDHPFDFKGVFSFIIAMIALNIIATQVKSLGFNHPIIITSMITFIISFSLFFYFEKKNPYGFIDLSIFKNKLFTGSVFANFALNGSAGSLLIASTYLQQGHHLSKLNASLLSIGYLISCLLMIRVGEKVLQKFGPKKPMMFGPTMTLAGLLVMSCTFIPGDSYLIAIALAYLIFGVGLGLFATPSIDTALTSTPANKVGIASGIFKMGSSLGSSFSFAISYTIYSSTLGPEKNYDLAGSYGFLFNAAMCFLCIVIVILVIPSKPTATTKES